MQWIYLDETHYLGVIRRRDGALESINRRHVLRSDVNDLLIHGFQHPLLVYENRTPRYHGTVNTKLNNNMQGILANTFGL